MALIFLYPLTYILEALAPSYSLNEASYSEASSNL